MAIYLSNKSFLYFLITQDIFLLNKANIIKYFIFNQIYRDYILKYYI